MVEIQSKEVIDKISEDLKIQPAMQIPRGIGKDVQLTYDVNPQREVKFAREKVSDSNSGALTTTHATKRTFLTSIYISVSKDAVNPSTNSAIAILAKGKAAQNIIELRYEPSTAGQFSQNISFPVPIELEKNSAITITNGSGNASIDTVGIVTFYETDPQ